MNIIKQACLTLHFIPTHEITKDMNVVFTRKGPEWNIEQGLFRSLRLADLTAVYALVIIRTVNQDVRGVQEMVF